MQTWKSAIMAAAIAAAITGCAPKANVASSLIEDKVYAVVPTSVTMKTGIVTGELTEMKITERVEEGTGRIDTPARLSGTLKLKNTSSDQIVRLLGGKIRYINDQGQPITLEEARPEPTLRFSSATAERLDPGQEATQSVDVDFPAEALKGQKLKELSLELTYVPSPYRQETATVALAIGSTKP